MPFRVLPQGGGQPGLQQVQQVQQVPSLDEFSRAKKGARLTMKSLRSHQERKISGNGTSTRSPKSSSGCILVLVIVKKRSLKGEGCMPL